MIGVKSNSWKRTLFKRGIVNTGDVFPKSAGILYVTTFSNKTVITYSVQTFLVMNNEVLYEK